VILGKFVSKFRHFPGYTTACAIDGNSPWDLAGGNSLNLVQNEGNPGGIAPEYDFLHASESTYDFQLIQTIKGAIRYGEDMVYQLAWEVQLANNEDPTDSCICCCCRGS
jgi:hypothetical protein